MQGASSSTYLLARKVAWRETLLKQILGKGKNEITLHPQNNSWGTSGFMYKNYEEDTLEAAASFLRWVDGIELRNDQSIGSDAHLRNRHL